MAWAAAAYATGSATPRGCGIAISSGFWSATVRAGEGILMPSAR